MTKKVLVITDAQNEFITGALGNKECEAAVKYIVAAAESGEYYKVIFTKDTHTADYLHTQEGKRLPVLHGQEGTEGYKIHPDIVKAVQEHYAPEQILTVKKPTFGSLDFGNTLKAIWEEVMAAGEAAEAKIKGIAPVLVIEGGMYKLFYTTEPTKAAAEKLLKTIKDAGLSAEIKGLE